MSNYRCKQCGKFVSKDALKCNFCGTENPTSQPYVRKNGRTIDKSPKKETKTMFCPICNQTSCLDYVENLSSHKQLICGCCGSAVNNPYYVRTKFDFFEENIGKLLALIILIPLMIFVCIAGFSTSPYSFKQGQECVFTTDIMGGINEVADDRYVRYAIQDDAYGILELQMEGVVYGAFKGDPCVYIRDKSKDRVEVYLKNKGVNILVPRTSIRPQ